MKFLLGYLFAALLLTPLAFSGQQATTVTTGDAIARCGKCDEKKCKDGCECEKCKKKDADKKDVLLADEDKDKKCKDGCECDKCKKKKKKAEGDDKDEALIACKKCDKHNKKKDGDGDDDKKDDKKDDLLLVA
jgi:hypothetical protein